METAILVLRPGGLRANTNNRISIQRRPNPESPRIQDTWVSLALNSGARADGQGFWLDIALGIVGAIVGGYLFSFWERRRYGTDFYSMLVAIAGSVAVLLLYNLVTGRRAV